MSFIRGKIDSGREIRPKVIYMGECPFEDEDIVEVFIFQDMIDNKPSYFTGTFKDYKDKYEST